MNWPRPKKAPPPSANTSTDPTRTEAIGKFDACSQRRRCRGFRAADIRPQRSRADTLLGEGLSGLLHFLRVSGDQNLLAELA
jgi:hypothetical protein